MRHHALRSANRPLAGTFTVWLAVVMGLGFAAGAPARTSAVSQPAGETYRREPMPPAFHVEQSELDGPVFADAKGRTLYRWPLKDLRNGNAGEQKGKPSCDNEK